MKFRSERVAVTAAFAFRMLARLAGLWAPEAVLALAMWSSRTTTLRRPARSRRLCSRACLGASWVQSSRTW
jgi:hypothetical protein